MLTTLTRKGLIAATAGLIIILLATIFVVSSILSLRSASTHLTESSFDQILITKRVSVGITRTIGEARVFAYSNEPSELEQAKQVMNNVKKDLATLDPNAIEEYEESLEAEAEFQELYNKRLDLFTRIEFLVNQLTNLDDAERSEVAEKLEDLEEQFVDLDQTVNEALSHETDEIAESNNNQINTVLMGTSVTFVVSMLFLLGSLALLRRYIIEPIQILSRATTSIIAGQRDTRVVVTSQDEIGTLQQNFNAMTQTLNMQTVNLEEQVVVANASRAEAESAQRDLQLKLQTINEQQAIIQQMSVPILPVMPNVIVMPLIGTLDQERLQLVNDQALKAIARTRATHLILDITGILVVDSDVAQGLIEVVQATHLLGAKVLLVGIRPEVAQTIISLGIDLDHVTTQSTLQSGIQAVQRQLSATTL